jgi:hypothetical protein
MNRNTTKGTQRVVVITAGTIQALRIMAIKELEEMAPGFAMRFDEKWERIFNKKKDSVLPIRDGENQKVRNSAKKLAHDGTRTRTHVVTKWH